LKHKLLRVGALFLLGLCAGALSAQMVTLTGTLQSSNGMPASNYVLSFTPSQFGFVANTSVIVNTATTCATSVDGSVVGVPNPLVSPPASISFTGTLPPANYFVKYAFYDAAGNLTLVSPETQIQLTGTGRVIVASPVAGLPMGAVGMRVYLSTTSNAETLQGSTTGTAAFIQSVPLVSGASPSATNTTICKQVANDTIWPTGTGYTVALTDPSGNTIPGYPMQWQLMGAGTTINLSNGLPYYHGTVFFPTPILASPLNHQLQSIAGPVSFSGYNLSNVNAIGFGTSLPAWPIDVENGAINASGGYIYNGGAGVSTGNCLLADSDTFHTFRVPGNCVTSLPTLFYQTVQANSTPVTQQSVLNFNNNFILTNTSGVTNVAANTTGSETKLVTAGGAGSTNNCASWDSSGGLQDSGAHCNLPIAGSYADVTSDRSFGTTFHNTGLSAIQVSGYAAEGPSGGSIGTISCLVGASSPTDTIWTSVYTATNSGSQAAFVCPVPANYFYEVTKTGDINTLTKWFEFIF
jgi:hypothetical protein